MDRTFQAITRYRGQYLRTMRTVFAKLTCIHVCCLYGFLLFRVKKYKLCMHNRPWHVDSVEMPVFIKGKKIPIVSIALS